MSVQWALSPHDFRAHAVADEQAAAEMMAAYCGHVMPREAGLDGSPRAQVCGSCLIMAVPKFEDRGALLNAQRDAEGITEWFPDDPYKPPGEPVVVVTPVDLGGWGGPPDGR